MSTSTHNTNVKALEIACRLYDNEPSANEGLSAKEKAEKIAELAATLVARLHYKHNTSPS